LNPGNVLNEDVFRLVSANELEKLKQEGCPGIVLSAVPILFAEGLTRGTSGEQDWVASGFLDKRVNALGIDFLDWLRLDDNRLECGVAGERAPRIIVTIESVDDLKPRSVKPKARAAAPGEEVEHLDGKG